MMPIFIILWTGDGANKLFNNCDDWLLTIDIITTQYAVIDTELETKNRVNYGSAKGSTENHYGHIDWVLCLKILLLFFDNYCADKDDDGEEIFAKAANKNPPRPSQRGAWCTGRQHCCPPSLWTEASILSTKAKTMKTMTNRSWSAPGRWPLEGKARVCWT